MQPQNMQQNFEQPHTQPPAMGIPPQQPPVQNLQPTKQTSQEPLIQLQTQPPMQILTHEPPAQLSQEKTPTPKQMPTQHLSQEPPHTQHSSRKLKLDQTQTSKQSNWVDFTTMDDFSVVDQEKQEDPFVSSFLDNWASKEGRSEQLWTGIIANLGLNDQNKYIRTSQLESTHDNPPSTEDLIDFNTSIVSRPDIVSMPGGVQDEIVMDLKAKEGKQVFDEYGPKLPTPLQPQPTSLPPTSQITPQRRYLPELQNATSGCARE